MRTEDIKNFWNENPCGNHFVEFNNYEDFFKEYDEFRYRTEAHILDEIDNIDFKDKKVLEIGLGQGADSQQIIKRGAKYSGIDLTEESIARLKMRFKIFNLEFESLKVVNAENIPFPDSTFDIVYSHGVIHHSPQINKIVSEIYRVLKPGGQFICMLYHKNSLNYYFSISVLRRFGIFMLYIPGAIKIISKLLNENEERLKLHKVNLSKYGLSYLLMKNFIHVSTDGPKNEFSTVWTKKSSKALLSKFAHHKYKSHFINIRHFPILNKIIPLSIWKKLEKRLGWHLWIYSTKETKKL